MKEQINITTTGNELVIREGKASEIREPQKIQIKGDIHSVRRFVDKERSGLQTVDKLRAVIEVNKLAGNITLSLDPENYYSPEVIAQLEPSDELKPFFINQDKTFTREQLIKLIRFNKLIFADKDKHTALLEAFQKLSAQTAADVKAESDTRGNKANAFTKTVQTNIPEEFILVAPIFKWQPAQTFRVEIAYDTTEASIRFWFESVELNELLITQREDIFNKELDELQDFVIINC